MKTVSSGNDDQDTRFYASILRMMHDLGTDSDDDLFGFPVILHDAVPDGTVVMASSKDAVKITTQPERSA